jgi:hypothetical protein
MVFGFLLQTFCVLFVCFKTYPEVKVQHKEINSKLQENWNKYSLQNSTNNPPLAFTECGWVQGYYQKTILGRNIAAFEGIPYGQSPTGQLRFRVSKK